MHGFIPNGAVQSRKEFPENGGVTQFRLSGKDSLLQANFRNTLRPLLHPILFTTWTEYRKLITLLSNINIRNYMIMIPYSSRCFLFYQDKKRHSCFRCRKCFLESNVQTSWQFIINWILFILHTWIISKISKTMWMMNLL